MSYAVPQVNWSPLGNLLDTYQQARDQRTLRSLGGMIGPDGSPDYGRMAQAMFSAGNADAGLRLSQLAEGRRAYGQTSDLLREAFSQSAPRAPSAPSAPAVPGTPPGLIGSESGGNWRAQNDAAGAGGHVGHFGRLQFGTQRINEAAAAGAIPRGTTPQQFMASPQLQQAAERWHFGDIDQKIRENGLDRFVGQSIGGVPVTMDGMRAVAHLGGSEGLRRFILTGGRYNPADRNGTRLSDYFSRHATRGDTLSGGDGLDGDAAPLIDGRYLPPDSAAPALGRPAMSPADAFAATDSAPLIDGRSLPPDASGASAPMQVAGLPEGGPQPAGMVAPTAPQAAPMPQPRPVQVMAQAPMPVARPNIEPPVQAQPAVAPMQAPAGPQMSERDRLMLLRDEQSLGAGEADMLRGRAPAPAPAPAAPRQMLAPQPTGGPLSALARGPAAPVPQQPQPAAPQPAAGGDIAQRIMLAMANPALPDASRQALAAALQRLQPDLQILARPDGSVWAVDKRNPQNARQIITGTAAPVDWQPQKDEAGNITGFYNPRTMEIRDAQGRPLQRPSAAPATGAVTPRQPAPSGASPQPQPPTSAASTQQTGPTGLPLNRTAFQRQQDERAEMARRNGIREGSDEYKFLMVNGRLPTAGEKLTEQQSKDLIYHRRGALALEVLDGPVDPNNPQSPRLSDALTSGIEGTAGSLPLVGNYLKRDVYQRAEQAGRNFLAAILRKDTGAAITAQEMTIYGATFLPQPGDSAGVLAQKAEARKQALEAIRAGLGTAEAKAIGEAAIRESGARSRGQQPGAALGPGVSRADLEAEARRRGLIQ